MIKEYQDLEAQQVVGQKKKKKKILEWVRDTERSVGCPGEEMLQAVLFVRSFLKAGDGKISVPF